MAACFMPVGSDPTNQPLRQLLEDHKQEGAQRTADATGLAGREVTLLLIVEKLTQSWPLHGRAAITAAKALVSAVPAESP